MVAGFDRYFQIAPCFRDEDARADRSPGEFYQLDVEMSFVTQDDVFGAIEPVLAGVFTRVLRLDGDAAAVSRASPYDDAMAMYGSDKPDLRNPIRAADVTEIFRGSEFAVFARAVEEGAVVRAIRAPGAAEQSRSFFDKTVGLGRDARPGRAGVYRRRRTRRRARSRSICRRTARKRVFDAAGVQPGDAVFFVSGAREDAVERPIDGLRNHLGEGTRAARGERLPVLLGHRLSVLRAGRGDEPDRLQPQPVLDAAGRPRGARTQDPLSIKAFQYDIVCNGVELSSGAIRNHRPDVMLRAFEIAGYGPRGGREAVRRHAERVPPRRAAARRARRRASTASSCCWPREQHPRGHRVSDDAGSARSADAGSI